MTKAGVTVLAIDLGAESGRVMAVRFDGGRLHTSEVHRFANTPVTARGTLYWNVLELWRNIAGGIAKAKGEHPASLGVDTWAIDFALLDARGELLGNPVHYRDARTGGMMEAVFARLDRRSIFEETGIQFMPINTLYQLMSLVAADDPKLKAAKTFLTIPDLLNYWLTGAKVCEFTNATTTQLFNPGTGSWSAPILEALGLDRELFPEVMPPGTRLGSYEGLGVIAPACHDTGSAVAGVPAQEESFAYISSGTWSLVGTEVKEPIITEEALAANLTNEGGVAGTYRLLKNVMGLWIVQQCRQTWAAEGQSYSYAELAQLAEAATPLRSLLPVDHEAFLRPGDHPDRVRRFCRESGQAVPETPGEIIRAVLESLALAYKRVLEGLEGVTGQHFKVVHIVGGGANNALLCQMTADATGLEVIAGPVEATVLGNASVQLMALGEISTLAEARELVGLSSDLRRYRPRDEGRWEEAYGRYLALASH